MANAGGTRGEGINGQRTRSSNHVVETFVPSSAWTEDSNVHYLLVDLPDFKKEEVRIQVDSSGQIMVSGERLVNNKKYLYFEQTFKIPDNSDIDNISGRFDGEFLYVNVPKQAVKKNEEAENDNAEDNAQQNHLDDENLDENNEDLSDDDSQNIEKKENSTKRNSVDGFPSELLTKWGQEATPLQKVMKMICKNKGILITAVIAFSLGVLVTRTRFESAGE